jgi:hypothetical protein
MKVHELAAAQRAERDALAVLHFEQQLVSRARTALAVAMLGESTAQMAYDKAVAERVRLERPEVET